MDTINNCDELLAYLTNEEFFNGSHKYSCGGYLEFQGDLCEVGGFMPDKWCLFMMSTKFPKTLFSIQDYGCQQEHFILFIFKGDRFYLDQTLGIILPTYVRDELIATIQGYN